MNKENTVSPPIDPDLARLDTLASVLDNRFRIPGTQIRFGLDGLIGLVPYLGDVAGFAVSGVLFSVMLRRGASAFILLRMMSNFMVDALVGTIPLLGDLFDFGFKANRRNVDLLKQYYAEEGPKPSVRRSVLLLMLFFFAFLVLLIWLAAKAVAAFWSWLGGLF
ncbi:MAG: DUF4112 domain-containing protein [Saprospiraceae bacterium]|nr:DUF4112 domain-containing protein [Saprospiraceae bacterium]